MIGLDTNVVVRYLVGDNEEQAEAARALFTTLSQGNPGFIGREVAVELVWVLSRSYRASREQIASVLLSLVATENIVVENAEDVADSAIRFADGVSDFADLMILAAARREAATPLYTFDRRASRMEGVELLAAGEG